MSSSLRRLLTCVCHWDFEGSLVADDPADPDDQCRAITIDDLPDDVLLAIFDIYVAERQVLPDITDLIIRIGSRKREIESWLSLVHVCQSWRGLVFASPRRLDLRLCCTPVTSARMSLDIWPSLPLHIQALDTDGRSSETSVDNVIATLEHSDRIRQIEIYLDPFTTLQIEMLWTAMQVPFTELIDLKLEQYSSSYLPVLPDSFLRGSAPRLRSLGLISIPFPGIPKLLLSAPHLVQLRLRNIPDSGYISPEAMVTCLSALTSLEVLQLEFESPESCPDLETRPPFLPTRFVLPTLADFCFKGTSEYLEEFVARIDAPQVYKLSITFFDDIHFDTPELTQFISRTPTLGVYDEACLIFNDRQAVVTLSHPPKPPNHTRIVQVYALCQVSDWRLSSLTQICALSFRPLLTMENLYIYEDPYPHLDWGDDIEDTEWLNLLHPFSAVKDLYLSRQIAPRIAPALQELTGERTTEVLPALQNLFLEGFQASEPVQEGITRFISARQLTNQPVVISVWDR